MCGFNWVVTYTACPLRKLTWIVKTYCFDAAKIRSISLTSKYFRCFFLEVPYLFTISDFVSLDACGAYSSMASLKKILSFEKSCLFILFFAHLFVSLHHRLTAIRFLCGSMDDETFTGSDGEVATLTIAVGNLAEGDKSITLRNIKLTETDISKSYTTEELTSTLTISLQKRGDANGDGTVTVTDIAVVVNLILQLQNTNFSSYGADANGDGSVTVTDIGVIVDMILGNNNANSRELNGLEPQ